MDPPSKTAAAGAPSASASASRPTHRLIPFVALSAWFVLNGAMVMLNRYIFMPTGINFPFPLTLTLLHMATGYLLSTLSILTFLPIPLLAFAADNYPPEISAFIGLFVANIVLGNTALLFIPVSFMQTLKSLTPFSVTLVQLFVAPTQRPTLHTIAALVPVVSGVALASAKELSFNVPGFAAGVGSSLVQGAQIVYGARVMKTKMDPFNMTRFVAPPALLVLIPLAILVEGHSVFNFFLREADAKKVSFVAASCAVAFLLNLSMFWVLKVVSGLTYSVAGNLKVVLIVFVSVWLFQNPLSVESAVGSVITVAGCTWYGLIKDKYVEKKGVEVEEAKVDVEEPVVEPVVVTTASHGAPSG